MSTSGRAIWGAVGTICPRRAIDRLVGMQVLVALLFVDVPFIEVRLIDVSGSSTSPDVARSIRLSRPPDGTGELIGELPHSASLDLEEEVNMLLESKSRNPLPLFRSKRLE